MAQLEQLIAQLQNGTQQLQLLEMQRQTLALQSREIEKALEALETAEDDIYKSVGPVLVKASKQAMEKELQEGKEEAALKLKSVETQEKRLRTKMKELQEQLQAAAAEEGPHAGTGG